jgi:hypothetical protein
MDNVIISIDSAIFVNEDAAIIFLVEQGVLKNFLICENCDSQMQLVKNSAKCNGKEYKCRNNLCKKRKSIYFGFKIKFPNIKITKILRCLYYYILELTNYQVTILTGVSEKTYISLKKYF